MDKKYTVSSNLKYATFGLMAIGAIAFGIGFFTDPHRAWANFLLNNYYFLSVAIGASFFLAIQYITQSGWSSMFQRVGQALGGYIPVAGAIMLLLFAGLHSLYHWSHHDAVAHDAILQHKSVYLNVPFFIIRYFIYFGLWIFITMRLRKLSLKEDQEGGMENFVKSEYLSRVYIFVLGITFSAASVDWIMSVDAHWFSTLFALKNFVAAFHHGTAAIVLFILLLNKQGYFADLNKSHLHDFSKYLFMLSIMWGYFWFSQYFLIWFADMPEESIYYVTRIQDWKFMWFLNLFLNWTAPFLLLMANNVAKSKLGLKIASIILLLGLWVDLYVQIMPGTGNHFSIGFIEIGAFLGFAGLFIFVVTNTLSKAPLIPVNHPYLEESEKHHTH